MLYLTVSYCNQKLPPKTPRQSLSTRVKIEGTKKTLKESSVSLSLNSVRQGPRKRKGKNEKVQKDTGGQDFGFSFFAVVLVESSFEA